MGPIQSLEDFLDMLRRRAGLILAVSIAGVVLSVWAALQKQHMYSASEVLQIARPKIADDLAGTTVEGSSARRLQLIQQRLMTRGTILEVIETFDLYRDMPALKPSEKVDLFRQSVRIDGVAAAREGYTDDGTISVLTITAEMPRAQQAQQIAHDLARRTIDLSVKSRIEKARETLTFIADQETALIAEVVALEAEITQFRNEFDLALPGTVDFRRDEIATINQGLLDIAREKIEVQRNADRAGENERAATARRILEEAAQQIATLDAQQLLLAERKAELEKLLETSPEVERRLGAYQRQMARLQEELTEINARRAEAEVGFRLEAAGQSENLTVIEPAMVPDYPSTGSRKTLVLMGAVASLGAGLVLAFLLDLRTPVLRSAAQMKRETGLSPVVSIPVLDTSPPRPGLIDRLRRLAGLGDRRPLA
jgi:uncharacterized protein involved in exopolysaccharide biosynthesis